MESRDTSLNSSSSSGYEYVGKGAFDFLKNDRPDLSGEARLGYDHLVSSAQYSVFSARILGAATRHGYLPSPSHPDYDDQLKKLTKNLEEDIGEGKTFGQSLKYHPRRF